MSDHSLAPPSSAEPPGLPLGIPEILSHVRPGDFDDEWYELHSADHFWFQWRLRVMLDLVRRVGLPADEPLRVLDIGGGIGVLRQQLERALRWTVDLTDLNLRALQRAAPGRGATLYYDVEDGRPDRVGAYDVVVVCDVLEHIERPAPLLAAAAEHVRPGGWMLVNVPALPWLFSDYDRAAGHHRRYDRRALLSAIDPFDLDVRDVRYWGMSLVPLLVVSRLLRRRRAGEAVRAELKPGPLVHRLLRALMRAETALLARPWVGTSLLLAAQRRVSSPGAGQDLTQAPATR